MASESCLQIPQTPLKLSLPLLLLLLLILLLMLLLLLLLFLLVPQLLPGDKLII